MLAEFFAWWWQHLTELVPEPLRRGTGPEARALVVQASTDGVLTLQRRRRGGDARIGSARLDEPGQGGLRAALNGRPAGEPVVLRLPPGMLMERTVALPLAAERDPERVLGFDMDRLTPFTANEVYWGYAVENRDRARGRLTVRLSVVPRASVQDLTDMLTACGGRPSLLEAPAAGAMRAIRLQHDQTAGRLGWLTPRIAGGALAALAALVVVTPFLRQSLEMDEAQGRLDELAPHMRVVDQLRRTITGAGAGGDAVASETRKIGDMLEALAAVTEILPDDSYLTEFTMRERKMTLSGMSASAPRLISALSADPRIRNPAFTAPVTTSDNGHKDVFSIRADLAP